jgi:hypothetical protein
MTKILKLKNDRNNRTAVRKKIIQACTEEELKYIQALQYNTADFRQYLMFDKAEIWRWGLASCPIRFPD